MQYSSSSEQYSSSLRDSPSKWSGNKEDKGYMYKKSSYQYGNNINNNNNNISTSPNINNNTSTSYYSKNNSSDRNIEQLDALLEDLKNERQFSRDKDILNSSYRTIERERPDAGGNTITRTTRVVKTTKGGVSPLLNDTIDGYGPTDYSTLRSNNALLENTSTLKRNDYQTKEITYGSSKPVQHYESKTKLYESNRALDNLDILPAATTGTISRHITTTNTSNTLTDTELQNDLQNIALAENILPPPGTKVTTTVRTYTYEVPAGSTLPSPSSGGGVSPGTTMSSKLITSNNYNTLQRQEYNSNAISPGGQRPHVPQTVVYNTESYSTINRNSERPIVSNQSYEVREHRESNTNTIRNGPHSPNNNTTLAYLPPQQQARSPGSPIVHPGNTSKTIVYNINKTENISGPPEPHEPQHYYPHSPSLGRPGPGVGQGPAPGPTTSRYFYKESSNVVNTVRGAPPPHNEPLNALPPQQRSPHGGGYPPHGDGAYPPNGHGPSSVTYKYSSSSTTNTSHRGPNDYGSPPSHGLTRPAPFPVDGSDLPNGNPPQRVEELMQSFTSDTVDRNVNIETPHRKREIETSVASPNQPIIPSINRAGKEVYYPPGGEMIMTKREEMSASSAAGGRWAKGSGNYEYESGYKSKTTTKSGGAMVPVCLPLCCAMPCSIM